MVSGSTAAAWRGGLPVLLPADEQYRLVVARWARRLTRRSPSFAARLAERHQLLAVSLEAALADLEAGDLERDRGEGL